MAEKVINYLVDDVTNEALMDEPGQTVRFATYARKNYEFDASEATAAAFAETQKTAAAGHKHAIACAQAAFEKACQKANDNYDAKLADYVAVSRKAGKGKAKTRKQSGTGTVERQANKAIREAARAAGVEVSERGRIPGSVKAQFSHAASS